MDADSSNMPRRAYHVLLFVALACAFGNISGQSDPPPTVPGRLIDLGGYRLHLNCTGQGTPTVVLSAGAGDFSFDWALVQPEVAKFSRVCSYDRSGEAWSDLGPKPRSMYQEVFDLERLLATGGERGPYILVGQSLGGMVARIFAMQYPNKAAGVVLVDAFSEDAQLSMNGKLVRIRETAKPRAIPSPRDSITEADRLSDDEKRSIKEFTDKFVGRPSIEPPFDKLPSPTRRARLWALSQPAHYAAGDDYMAEIAARIYSETRAVQHPLGDIPIIVLQRTKDEYPPDQAATLSKEHREQQERLAALSSRGELISVPSSGHHIQIDQPGAVVDAIRSAVSHSRH